ncbi:nicotinamide-nucleotide adenylyltransferase NDAI_0A00280 [Naumovozyma dairenensis CBS 421]|uniref:Cytidyltransferase-like domain-containing protein n=1 Tax=Naumovozyma dairenensis (strain ATCC 10597 / BCRC 20456 / CBS 421 / NBRC 0211 / NRRL Y-12639) TaxID=1071378 RepID=G0W5H4_NAUDC|nr:hypothetical protein NDAI_0A00280 [Naumovozyma dairenensis CBS 421]CCD22188.1 hypothetical protein NDAI_0A00280 [Naumovozyma dairenensis CBS 421]
MMNYSKLYEQFRESNNKFQVIHGKENLTKVEKLLVLDSSFNPPHYGHYTLVKKSLEFYKQKLVDHNKIHVLLLLSTNNADKAPTPAAFPNRMEMMCLMANLLSENENISVSVAITIFGKFIDKTEIIKTDFYPTSEGDIVYLVGFDTIIRIFDPKYYLPITVLEALEIFMEEVEFCCLTRIGSDQLMKQLSYSADILAGKYEPIIPRQWGARIHVLSNDERYSSVSSSEIRELVNTGRDKSILTDKLPDKIIDYIFSRSSKLF